MSRKGVWKVFFAEALKVFLFTLEIEKYRKNGITAEELAKYRDIGTPPIIYASTVCTKFINISGSQSGNILKWVANTPVYLRPTRHFVTAYSDSTNVIRIWKAGKFSQCSTEYVLVHIRIRIPYHPDITIPFAYSLKLLLWVYMYSYIDRVRLRCYQRGCQVDWYFVLKKINIMFVYAVSYAWIESGHVC